MKQLTQQLKSGYMEIIEAPFPMISDNQILVRNHYSIISAGTEGKTVTDARKGYIAKARSRQKEVKQVISMIKSEGLKKTYDVVMNKLEAPSPLGYSCAGEVIAVGNSIQDLKAGDRVACGGDGAYHAEVVAVNRKLCTKVPDNVNLSHAAFTTISAIAIQGIRQADLRFGENCVVIGLGLIGQLTIQILKAAGIKAIGVDIDPSQVEKAKEIGADLSISRNVAGIKETLIEYTKGYGTDAVIITAGTTSNDPVEFAGEICRKKGKVIIVGAVPTGFSRANYYKKELELKMSSSYGPGRYDSNYEEKARDYPIGYVRFTENRNMETFIDLLADNKLNINQLISHKFPLLDAPKAYDMVVAKKESTSGILLEYETQNALKRPTYREKSDEVISGYPNIGLLGAGSFAQNEVLPIIKDKCNFISIATRSSDSSYYIKKKYGFENCTDSANEIFTDRAIDTVFVLTRHNTHANYVIKALENGKNVFVEKPLALTLDELNLVKESYAKTDKKLMLGFNRRFSPLTEKLYSLIPITSKKAINIRVNAGSVSEDHWVNDPDIGGGRIIGELCHFLDLAGFIAGSKTVSLYANKLLSSPDLNDTVNVNLSYENGSIANICYYSNGNSSLPKERIEVFSNDSVYIIDDFITMTSYTQKGKKKIKLNSQDKGHKREFEIFFKALMNGDQMPISFSEIYDSTMLSFEVLRSIKENRAIAFTEDE